MNIVVDQISPQEWSMLSENAHLVVFNEKRPAYMDRIDYALIANKDNEPCGYVTVREVDCDNAYWQYGGAFPGTKGTTRVVFAYKAFVEWMRARYKRISTLVENTNTAYLKLALTMGFRIIGIRIYKETILAELLLDFEEGDVKCFG